MKQFFFLFFFCILFGILTIFGSIFFLHFKYFLGYVFSYFRYFLVDWFWFNFSMLNLVKGKYVWEPVNFFGTFLESWQHTPS